MHIEEQQLKAFIVDSGLVSRAEMDEAVAESEEGETSLTETLIKKGKLSKDHVRHMQAYVLGIPFVDLKEQKIPMDILSLIPEPIARVHNIVAFKKTDDVLEVAMLDTNDLAAIEFIKKKAHFKILPRITDTDSIKSVLLAYQRNLKAQFGDSIQQQASHSATADSQTTTTILDSLLKHALLQNASDIHIEPLETEMLVRYRIAGALHDAMMLPKHLEEAVISRIKMLAHLKLDSQQLPQDGRFKAHMTNETVSFRVSILPTYFGEKVVVRILREHVSGFTLEGLGFHGVGLERLHQALTLSKGLIVVAGPADSGKTTTLYTFLDILNTPNVSISTIEDPIEYQMPRINQSQVKEEIGFRFASGVRAISRQDPDIMMIGSIDDKETASLAINVSLAGRLVLSGCTNLKASDVLARLVNMKIDPLFVASTIEVVVGQRLVRKLSSMKEKYFLSKAELAALGQKIDLDRVLRALKNEKIVSASTGWDDIPFYKAPTGKEQQAYSGKIGINEVLKMTASLKELLIKGAAAAEIEAQAKKEGMLDLLEDGIFKAVQGMTTLSEILRVDKAVA